MYICLLEHFIYCIKDKNEIHFVSHVPGTVLGAHKLSKM